MLKIKLMWADESTGIWDMEKEQLISKEYLGLPENLVTQISSWLVLYREIYKGWLDNNDSDGLFDIRSKINLTGRKLCKKIENTTPAGQCYYWFDVDRSKNESKDFIWKNCPICKRTLTPTNLNIINRNVCESCKVVFP